MSNTVIKYDEEKFKKTIDRCINEILSGLELDTHYKLITGDVLIQDIPSFSEKIPQIKAQRAEQFKEQYMSKKRKHGINEEPLDITLQNEVEAKRVALEKEKRVLLFDIHNLEEQHYQLALSRTELAGNNRLAGSEEKSLSATELLAAKRNKEKKLADVNAQLEKVNKSLEKPADNASKRGERRAATGRKNQLNLELDPEYQKAAEEDANEYAIALQYLIERYAYGQYLLAVKSNLRQLGAIPANYKPLFLQNYESLEALNRCKQAVFDIDKAMSIVSTRLEAEKNTLSEFEKGLSDKALAGIAKNRKDEENRIAQLKKDVSRSASREKLAPSIGKGMLLSFVLTTVIMVVFVFILHWLVLPAVIPLSMLAVGSFLLGFASIEMESKSRRDRVAGEKVLYAAEYYLECLPKTEKTIEIQQNNVKELEEKLEALQSESTRLNEEMAKHTKKIETNSAFSKQNNPPVSPKKYKKPIVQDDTLVPCQNLYPNNSGASSQSFFPPEGTSNKGRNEPEEADKFNLD